MRRFFLLLAGTVVLFVHQSRADAVSDWNATAVGFAPLFDVVYMHIAIYDAVNAIDGRYTTFAVAPANAVPWASKEAATAAAARGVLVAFYPTRQPFIDSVYAARIAMLPNDSTRARGIVIGEEVAQRFLALRQNDGRLASVPYTFLPLAPGVYQLTPGAPAPPATPLIPWLAHLRPFAMTSVSQFRAAAVPVLTSATYTQDFNEVKRFGLLDTSQSTPQQRETGRFYSENAGIQYARAIRDFAATRGLSLADNARLFAQLYVAMTDGLIAGWDSKFHYNFWRPVTAIRNADIDGNPSTERDTSWLPLVVTPNHQEYISTHSALTGAMAVTLERFFGTPNLTITFTSTVTGTSHTFTNLSQMIDEMINARVWGGMHFRTSNQRGIAMGQEVGRWVAQTRFLQRSGPIPMAHLRLWLRADSGVTRNGTTVSNWADQSGNGNHAIQFTADRQPLFVTSGLNGKPILRFDGLNDKLGFTGSARMSKISYFLVFKNDSGAMGSNPNNVLTFGAAGGALGEQYFMLMRGAANIPDRIGIGGDFSHGIQANATNIAAYGAWRYVSVTTNQTIWNTTLRWNQNDASMVTVGSDVSISIPLGDPTGSGGGIGGADGVPLGTIVAKCDAAELIVYDTVLTQTERLSIEQYLCNKYAFPECVTGVSELEGNLPERFVLEQNYPNPFNPSTSIRFSLPTSGLVTLKVYDVLGREVRTLVNENLHAGSYETTFDATGLASGVYFYRLQSGELSQTKRLLLLR